MKNHSSEVRRESRNWLKKKEEEEEEEIKKEKGQCSLNKNFLFHKAAGTRKFWKIFFSIKGHGGI